MKPLRARPTVLLALLASVFLATAALAESVRVGTTRFGTNFVANSPITIVSPTSNTEGLELKSAVLYTSGSGVAYLMTEPSGTAIFMIGNTAEGVTGNLPFPLFLPAGTGLTAQGSVAGSVWVTYDLLP